MPNRERELEILIDALRQYYETLVGMSAGKQGQPQLVSRSIHDLRADVLDMVSTYTNELVDIKKEANKEEVMPNERTVID